VLSAIAVLATGSAQAATRPVVEAAHGMVISSQSLASEVGAEILKQGGNAIDGASAVGYAEAVTNPCCANIGGGALVTIAPHGDDQALILPIAAIRSREPVRRGESGRRKPHK